MNEIETLLTESGPMTASEIACELDRMLHNVQTDLAMLVRLIRVKTDGFATYEAIEQHSFSA